MESFVQLRVLSSQIKPKELAERINFQPDESWAIGDRRKNTVILEKENGYVVNSLLDRKAPMADHIANIRARISGTEFEFRKVASEAGCSVQISCAIYSKGAPSIYLEKILIGWMNEVGASLDIDIYTDSE
jgi:hypothetical protein